MEYNTEEKELRLGIDVGSTTVKLAITDPDTREMLYSRYERHYAKQMETVLRLLEEAKEVYPDARFRAAVCGSGGKPVAQALQLPFVQEVVANAAAVCELYPQARTAIELGGQDAKIIFFYYDEKKKRLQTSDMRMNGSCAGGTGAFIDEIATLLDAEAEGFEQLAAKGTHVFDISGRCGVFAKTDIQPLLIQGAAREDIALSSFHAIAKQTIGGLSQGLELKPPIIFEGGPLTFHPTLVRVFAERLQLKEEEIILPDHPETIVARGTSYAVDQLFPQKEGEQDGQTLKEYAERLVSHQKKHQKDIVQASKPFFKNQEEREQFEKRHKAEIRDVEAPIVVGLSGKMNEEHPDRTSIRTVQAYLGIDSGSTTSKMVLMDEKERVIDCFYANNQGNALSVVQEGILKFYDDFRKKGIRLEIIGLGTTGYGEKMLAKAFQADYHVVETVAHARACLKYYPDTTFLLDIGGQDMKAIWIDDGIITNIMLNEACSSGCGSFLENFAGSLGIAVEDAAEAAFHSKNPASLGSRCTVFMNSTIINEQRNGKNPEDIMAGLCRSIIENVFTKVVRISNVEELGDHIVVQGGTFRNQAVLRALEEYLGKNVTLAPYPGEMGALGAAILAKEQIEENGYKDAGTSFIGENAVKTFACHTQTGVRCPHCANHCSRTVMTFSTGEHWITGNRCERGEVLTEESLGGDYGRKAIKEKACKTNDFGNNKTNDSRNKKLSMQGRAEKAGGETGTVGKKHEEGNNSTVVQGIDLFAKREQMLFRKYDCHPSKKRKEIIGLPRVLEFWDSMPFWSTFFRALGYEVRFSHKSNRKMYEKGIEYVASDTICFPAKLVHGHILDLAEQGVDRIFMPYVMHMPPEGKDKKSPYVCSVVMGYLMVVRNSQNPEKRYGVVFDTPVFHWFQEKDRPKQICQYATSELHVSKEEAEKAYRQGEAAIRQFRNSLEKQAEKIISNARKKRQFVIVLAGRPYHSDSFVSHSISKMFTEKGISVIPVDSLPGLREADLKNTRIEITNNFHTRMLAGALLAAQEDTLEYVQIVSFGCGHDAVLSDEITRILSEVGHKSPLILKVDESEASGSLGIRVQSFIETIAIRRKVQGRLTDYRKSQVKHPRTSRAGQKQTGRRKQLVRQNQLGRKNQLGRQSQVEKQNQLGRKKDAFDDTMIRQLPQPSPAKFYKKDIKTRTLLIPNISAEVSVLLDGILEKEHLKVKTLSVGGKEQIRLGKKYVHNDICFPCQMVIGELLSELIHGNYNQDEVAVGMVKFQCDCRMSHYAGLLRKGLDSAGFSKVPILTTDVGDTKEMHPGVSLLGISAVMEAVWVFEMLDILTELCRKIRPYELHKGETNRVYYACVKKIADGIRVSISQARKVFEKCIDAMSRIPYDCSHLKPRVFVTGELLVTYHSGSNFHIEQYLEENGMETVFPRVTDQLRKDFRASECEIKDYHANMFPWPFAVTFLFDTVQKQLEKSAARHPLFEPGHPPKEMYTNVSDIIPETLSCGEGWLMAAEIDHYAREDVKAFIILQPFGCLPNHICGRGVIKKLKERFPDIHILPLDLDPDTSFANVENRLQMLLMDKAS